jgi:retron-type reverse transcriptase
MALEPIFEVEFHDSSFGFRPNRNAHHAVARFACRAGSGERAPCLFLQR